MKRHSYSALLLALCLPLLLLFACDLPPADRTPTPTPYAIPTVTQTEVPEPPCRESANPTDEDVDNALAFDGQVLDSDDWQRTYQVGTDRVRVIWTHDQGGLIFLESLIFVCGYTSEDVDQFFSRENIEGIIYADYQEVVITANCIHNDQTLRLYEISAAWDGTPYAIRHWVLTTHAQRVDSVLIAFPATAGPDLITYGERLFPKLESCPD